MDKRVITFVAALALVFTIAGCSSGAASSSGAGSADSSTASAASSASASSASSSGSALFADQTWPASEHAAEGLPVPEFSVAPESIQTSENSVTGVWSNVSDQEVADYVAKVKDAGFTVKPNETKGTAYYTYSAFNGEDTLNASNVMINYTAAVNESPSALMVMVARTS